MNKICVLALCFSVSAVAAENKYSALTGNWEGKITKNIKSATAGGKTTAGETGAPASIQWAATATGLQGKSVTAGEAEVWTINNDTYVWSDSEITVTTKAAELPAWAKTEAAVAPTEKVFAFQYAGCTIKKTNSPCKINENIPEAMAKSGFWIFKVAGNKLSSVVVYQYPQGGFRHLAEELTRKN